MVRRPERVAEEALWKAFWQNEGGIAPNDVMYRRAPCANMTCATFLRKISE